MLSLQYPLIIWFLKGITEKVSTSQSQEQEHRCTNVRAWGVGMAFGNLELLGWFCIWVLGDPYHFSRSPASRSELHLNLHLQPLPIPFITSLPLHTAWLTPTPTLKWKISCRNGPVRCVVFSGGDFSFLGPSEMPRVFRSGYWLWEGRGQGFSDSVLMAATQ